MTDYAIELRDVHKAYPRYGSLSGGLKPFLLNPTGALRNFWSRSFTVLEEVSFCVRRGAALGILGRNGAGKSTLLGMMAGVIPPTSGLIRVNGRVSPLLQLGAGFHSELTGRENIELNGILMGLRRRQILKKVDEIIEFSGLGEFIDEPVRIYSSGMTARLGFSVVAHLDPEILLIDEILGVGDQEFQAKCLEKISGFRNAGVTMILVTHNPTAVQSLCDEALWIHEHRVREYGEVEEVLNHYSGLSGVGE